MVRRLAAAGLTTVLEDRTDGMDGTDGTLNAMLIVSAVSYDKLEKAATPPLAVTLRGPSKLVEPRLRVALTTVLLSVVTKFSNRSWSWMTRPGEKATPAGGE